MIKCRTHKIASQLLELSIKFTRKQEGKLYTIDKSIPNPQIRWKICKLCQTKSKSSKCRKGYCQQCSLEGLGFKNRDNSNHIRWKECRICKKESRSAECRMGYCKHPKDLDTKKGDVNFLRYSLALETQTTFTEAQNKAQKTGRISGISGEDLSFIDITTRVCFQEEKMNSNVITLFRFPYHNH